LRCATFELPFNLTMAAVIATESLSLYAYKGDL